MRKTFLKGFFRNMLFQCLRQCTCMHWLCYVIFSVIVKARSNVSITTPITLIKKFTCCIDRLCPKSILPFSSLRDLTFISHDSGSFLNTHQPHPFDLFIRTSMPPFVQSKEGSYCSLPRDFIIPLVK